MDISNVPKYIKLVILRIAFILGLCNFKFSFKIPWQNYPTKLPSDETTSSTEIKISDPPTNIFLKRLGPHKLERVGACNETSENQRFSGVWKETSGMK